MERVCPSTTNNPARSMIHASFRLLDGLTTTSTLRSRYTALSAFQQGLPSLSSQCPRTFGWLDRVFEEEPGAPGPSEQVWHPLNTRRPGVSPSFTAKHTCSEYRTAAPIHLRLAMLTFGVQLGRADTCLSLVSSRASPPSSPDAPGTLPKLTRGFLSGGVPPPACPLPPWAGPA